MTQWMAASPARPPVHDFSNGGGVTLKGELVSSPRRPQPLAAIVCLHDGLDPRKYGESKQDD